MDGEVLEALGSGMFRVALDNGHELIAYTAGKMRRYRIRMAPGDRISVQLSVDSPDGSEAGRPQGSPLRE
jgi:translation initiation factor IF-1